MTLKKILPYLLLNIAVSAITMLVVILIWNAVNPSVVATEGLDGLTTSPVQTIEVVLPPLDQETIEIQSIFMPGELDYEKVTIKNISADPIDLSGWSLSNPRGEKFVFPSLTLYPNGAVDVYSQAGISTAVELFWNSSRAIWQAGETAILLDSAGNERHDYLIP